MKLLFGHISPETAYLVEDYPYGFRLRCKIRYWLEFHPKHGFRFVSQTTNPKRPVSEVWNKPKASTYCRFGAAMYLNEEGHVTWTGLSEYSDGTKAKAFLDSYGDAVPVAGLPVLKQWVATKTAYDAARADAKAEGNIPPLNVGLAEAHKAWLEHELTKPEFQPLTRDQKLELVWKHTHRDFRGHNGNAERTVLIYDNGTCLVRLADLTDAQINERLPKQSRE
jgi:hypothetical protein